eukprot:CAMPEP_0168541676 /NCGR_PEP_ID=MMETSP0413-20121227/946_1 /TAXON_ID=136452 /ORGANISM="Filamoeba nolandi, Strain NC-AS-23-1" /LENGTH=191 /DNA_ID=CAMNT_0008571511 /DNA_START=192 /DNA_END=764 /DNA_ORIENTATION=-
MILGSIASLIRIVVFAVDPFSEREILSMGVWAVLFNIPVVIAESIVLMLFLYWFEVAQKRKLDFPKNIKKMRPVLIGLCIFMAAILLPETIIANALQNVQLILISNILLAAVLLFIFGILVLAAFRLVGRLHEIRMVTSSPKDEESSQTEDVITMFIFRVRWYLAIIGFSMITLVAALVIYALTEARYKPW